jgi:transposase
MGHSRGELTTKIHTVVDANGNPVALKLSEGHAHDGRSAADLLDSVGADRILLADRGYDGDALRAAMAEPAHGPTSSPCGTG